MSKTIEAICAWLRKQQERRSKKRAARRQKALAGECEHSVQAREFCGEIYLCLNDVPLLPADGLSWDLPTAVAVAREAYVKWREKGGGYGR